VKLFFFGKVEREREIGAGGGGGGEGEVMMREVKELKITL